MTCAVPAGIKLTCPPIVHPQSAPARLLLEADDVREVGCALSAEALHVVEGGHAAGAGTDDTHSGRGHVAQDKNVSHTLQRRARERQVDVAVLTLCFVLPGVFPLGEAGREWALVWDRHQRMEDRFSNSPSSPSHFCACVQKTGSKFTQQFRSMSS